MAPVKENSGITFVLAAFILLASDVACGTWVKEAMRAAKCVVPDGIEHATRAALLQQCISKNYGGGNETQCYSELGCFPMDSPWTTLTRPLPTPHHPAQIDVRLYCYTRASPERYNITLWPEVSLNGCPFEAEKKTVFITHGFASDGNSSWLQTFKDKMLEQVDATVFIVDWGNGAQLYNYFQVASNTRIVGAEVARFVKSLQSEHKLRPQDVHLLGHSLGAQISAYVAKRVPGIGRLTGRKAESTVHEAAQKPDPKAKEQMSGVNFIHFKSVVRQFQSLRNISGAMDPAQPCFEMENKIVRLDKSDATFVEVIHTNGAPFIPFLGFGMINRHGHVDYYMNGGVRQPGCILPNSTEITSLTDLGKYAVEVINNLVSCSHGRSYQYYMQVLDNNCTIWARKANFVESLIQGATLARAEPLLSMLEPCSADTCLPLGLDAVCSPARGTFTASTSVYEPFCDDPKTNKKILSEIKQSEKKRSEKGPSTLNKATELPTYAKDTLTNVLKTAATVPENAKVTLRTPRVSGDAKEKVKNINIFNIGQI